MLLLTPGDPTSISIDRLLRTERDVVLTFETPGRAGLEPASSADLAAALAPLSAASRRVWSSPAATARAVLAAAGVEAIRVRGEIEPGVPIGVTMGARHLPVVTKAGRLR